MKAWTNQVDNRAENEEEGTMDFALPGVKRQPKPFIKLLKEAREANLVPPSLPTPSYSWEKMEGPEQDFMILPARRPKQLKESDSKDMNSGDNPTVSNNAVEESPKVEKKPCPPDDLAKPKSVPSLQSVIESMQKCQEVERQLKAKKEAQRAKQVAGNIQKAMTASQALKTAKNTAPVDYKERRRLRQEKEIEEARKELMEAARSALKDRIEFNKKERRNSQATSTVGKTMFCGSTKAMFNPEAPIGEAEETASEESDENEAKSDVQNPDLSPQSVVEEPAPSPQPTESHNANETQPKAAELKAEEVPKEEKLSVGKAKEEEVKNQRKKKRPEKDRRSIPQMVTPTNVAPPVFTNVPLPIGGNMMVNPMQGCLIPQQLVMPMPLTMQQPQFNPWSYVQVCPSAYPFIGGQGYVQSPFGRRGSPSNPYPFKHRKHRRKRCTKHHGDSSSSSNDDTSGSSSCSFSDMSSFKSGTNFSGNTEGSSTSSISSSILSSSDEDETGSSSVAYSTDDSSSSCSSSQTTSSTSESPTREWD